MLTTDLKMLVASGLLTMVLALVPNAGHRDKPLTGDPEWCKRAARAHLNLLENLCIFAIAVLVVHIAGRANDASALGAIIFFAARVLHAGIYIAGIPYVRTLVFGVGQAGILQVFAQLL
jgi:uncharacterized MAPEG superfamily protein